MRCRIVYITHFLCFVLGCSFAVLFLSYEIPKQEVEIEKEKFDLIIVILSAPDNVLRREAIRESWGSLVKSRTTVILFAIGGKKITSEQRFQIIQEQKLQGDLLILPVKDSYNNLANKVLETFSHLAMTYEFKYVFKCDDDTFINVNALEAALKELPENRLYWGYFSGTARVQRKGKWKETGWFLCDRYLPYALGGGYGLSYDLILYIVANMRFFSTYKSEDVSVGTWLAPLNITRKHDIRLNTGHVTRGCHNNDIAIHKQSVNELRALGRRLSERQPLCEKEATVLKPYFYNWSVLPSQCCLS